MDVGAFVCSCADTCSIDLEETREGVRDVEVVASSSLLCEDGLAGVDHLVDEYDLDQLIVTTPEPRCQRKFRALAEEKDLHPEAVEFVDHRELAGWVHDEAAATDKTARLINRTYAGLREEAVSRSVSREAGDRVAVVGDPETAVDLADSADVLLIAEGQDLSDVDVDLEDVSVERGRVVDFDGRYGEFELTLASRVTEDCVSCMKCVVEGPDEGITSRPVDIGPEVPRGEWVTVCPTDAIEMDGVERTIEVDQVVAPGAAPDTVGGKLGYHPGPVDAGTIAAVESNLGGVEKPKHLDLTMDVCAAGDSSQEGCTACSDACPHGAVDRPTVDSVEFDEVACQDCGACTSACPTGAVQLREPSNRRIAREVEALLESENDEGGWLFGGSDGIDTEVVAFLCSERAEDALRRYGKRAAAGDGVAYPPILTVSVDCTDTVGEAHVMHALAAGADGVAIVGCGGDCLHSGPDPKAALVDRLDRATRDLGLGRRVEFFAPDPADPGAFVEQLSEFVEIRLETSPIPTGEHEATGTIDDPERDNPAFDSHAWTLESVRAILSHVDPDREVIRGLKDFGRMDVSEACNLTPTCSTLCPTDAIRRTADGDLEFNHERCVNCGLCEEGCPETAITMKDGLSLDLLPENRDAEDPAWTTVYDGEMLECVRCGTAFTSRGSAEKVKEAVGDAVTGIAPDTGHDIFEYCPDCRSTLLFENRGGGGENA